MNDDGCELRAALEAADPSVTGTPQEGAPRKVTQTQTGPDGNCQSACLSMLLGIPLADIPNFTLAGDDDACFAAQQKWLAERGWGIVTIGAKGPFFKKWFGKGYTLAGGTSPRGLPHAVIYKDGELWHDPHPDGTGITEVTEVDILWPLNPSAWAILPANLAAARQERDDMMAMFDAVDIFMRYSTDGGATWQEYTLEERVRLAIAVCCDDDAEQRLAAAEARAEKAERTAEQARATALEWRNLLALASSQLRSYHGMFGAHNYTDRRGDAATCKRLADSINTALSAQAERKA